MRYLGSKVCLSFATWIGLTKKYRWSFNMTLFISGVFGLAAGGSLNFVTLASLIAVVGIGAGGTFV